MRYKTGHIQNMDFISILIQPVSWAMINFSFKMYRMFSNEIGFQSQLQSTGILSRNFCVLKFLLEFSFVFFQLNTMTNSVNEIMVNCDKLMKSFWRIRALIQEFQSNTDFKGSHRIEKFIVFLCKHIVLKSVNWSSLIGRYAWTIYKKLK